MNIKEINKSTSISTNTKYQSKEEPTKAGDSKSVENSDAVITSSAEKLNLQEAEKLQASLLGKLEKNSDKALEANNLDESRVLDLLSDN